MMTLNPHRVLEDLLRFRDRSCGIAKRLHEIPIEQGGATQANEDTQKSLRRNRLMLMLRKWVERYYNPKRWTIMPSGGHFVLMEEPQMLIDDVRAFFRTLGLCTRARYYESRD